jgi:hypothetical protein
VVCFDLVHRRLRLNILSAEALPDNLGLAEEHQGVEEVLDS